MIKTAICSDFSSLSMKPHFQISVNDWTHKTSKKKKKKTCWEWLQRKSTENRSGGRQDNQTHCYWQKFAHTIDGEYKYIICRENSNRINNYVISPCFNWHSKAVWREREVRRQPLLQTPMTEIKFLMQAKKWRLCGRKGIFRNTGKMMGVFTFSVDFKRKTTDFF